jgi:hypothetical protein
MAVATIDDWHATLQGDARAVCDSLRDLIDAGLPDATAKVWHAHPVWFLVDNPIVGYSLRKSGAVNLMFWSGQSFATPGLTPEGKFKVAEVRFASADQIDSNLLHRWLDEARHVQWDYKNIVRRKGELVRLI